MNDLRARLASSQKDPKMAFFSAKTGSTKITANTTFY
jgi:hypothetical protein